MTTTNIPSSTFPFPDDRKWWLWAALKWQDPCITKLSREGMNAAIAAFDEAAKRGALLCC